jgi:hypothetical protein
MEDSAGFSLINYRTLCQRLLLGRENFSFLGEIKKMLGLLIIKVLKMTHNWTKRDKLLTDEQRYYGKWSKASEADNGKKKYL